MNQTLDVRVVCQKCGGVIDKSENEKLARDKAERHNEEHHGGDKVAGIVTKLS